MMCFKHAIFPFSCHNALLCVCQFYITDYNNGSRLGAYCKLKNCSFQILSWRNILKICIFWMWTTKWFFITKYWFRQKHFQTIFCNKCFIIEYLELIILITMIPDFCSNWNCSTAVGLIILVLIKKNCNTKIFKLFQ